MLRMSYLDLNNQQVQVTMAFDEISLAYSEFSPALVIQRAWIQLAQSMLKVDENE
jgi:hypothetical protein